MYWEVKIGLAFPTLLDVIVNIVFLVVGVPVVYLLSRALKLHPKPVEIQNPRKEAALAFLLVVTVFAGVSVWRILTDTVFDPNFGELQPFVNVRAIDVMWEIFLYVIVMPPLVLAMRKTGQDRGSVGIDGKAIGRMLALGFMLGTIMFTIRGLMGVPLVGGGFAGFSPSLIYGLIFFTIVGFGEEIVWRGYIQTRLVAYGGTLKGLVVTSLLFAVLWHFPGRYYMYSGVVLEAFANTLLLFPLSLVLGYIMIRSQNIIPSSIFHLFLNWSILFWQITI
jgi:membrane protease YdiL (CAAX protease family)